MHANAISKLHALVVLCAQVPKGMAPELRTAAACLLGMCDHLGQRCPQSVAARVWGGFASAVAPVAGLPASFCL
jgi:hypothetical protein